jgi:hypothetical protein
MRIIEFGFADSFFRYLPGFVDRHQPIECVKMRKKQTDSDLLKVQKPEPKLSDISAPKAVEKPADKGVAAGVEVKPKKKIFRPYRQIGFCRQCKARYFVDLDAPFSVRFYCDACRAKHAKHD